ncbi:MAG: tetratricopeptide repeat protein [Hyphomicrobiaceae bacterium]
MSSQAQSPANDPDKNFLEARTLFEKKQMRKAERICKKILQQTPRHAEALNLAGQIELGKGNAKQAFELFRAAAGVDPQKAEYHANAGHVLASAGKFAPAETALRQAIDLQADHARAHHDLGGVLLNLGHFDEADSVFAKAAEIAPDKGWPHANRGIALQNLDKFEEAIAAYRRALVLDPKDVHTLVNLGSALAQTNQTQEAVDAYSRATEHDPKRHDAFGKIGNLYMTGGDYTQAVPALRRAVQLEPRDMQSYLSLAYALAIVGEADEAEKICLSAINKAPKLVLARTNLAFAHLRNNKPELAKDVCEAALEIAPGHTALLAYYCVALNELGEREAAGRILSLDELVRTQDFDVAGDGGDPIATFNTKFVDLIKANPTLSYSENNRTLNAGQSTQIFDGAAEPLTTVFLHMIETAIEDYKKALPKASEHPFLAVPPPDRYKIEVWANIMDASGFHDTHFHPTGWLSGVYYPQLPSVVSDDDPNHEGWIEFGRAPAVTGSTDEPPVRLVRPKEGLAVLFPSYMGHKTIPCNSDEKRVSVAFDVVRE